MVTSNRNLLVELIQEAYTAHVLDQFGSTMSEAYLLDNWKTDEGFLVNAITKHGLIHEAENQERIVYEWKILRASTLQEALTYLKEESFA